MSLQNLESLVSVSELSGLFGPIHLLDSPVSLDPPDSPDSPDSIDSPDSADSPDLFKKDLLRQKPKRPSRQHAPRRQQTFCVHRVAQLICSIGNRVVDSTRDE